MYDLKLVFWVYWVTLVTWWVLFVILLIRLRQKGNLKIEKKSENKKGREKYEQSDYHDKS